MGGLNSGYGLGTSGGVGGGGSTTGTKSVTQTLNTGINSVTHSLGASYTVSNIVVFDSTGKIPYAVEWEIVDSNTIKITLPSGSISNAVIRISYY